MRPLAALVILATAGLVLGTLVLVGQPLYANDSWIHLALGRAFWEAGPFLDHDPALFAAPGPPAPSSWLGSVALYMAQAHLGFTGLRVLHVALGAGLFVLVGDIARRAGRAWTLVPLAAAAFLGLATFRLVQLRPELATIAATFALYLIVTRDPEGPSRRALGGVAVLTAVWSNLHAGFVLAPILLVGTTLYLTGLSVIAGATARRVPRRERVRVLRWAAASLLAAGRGVDQSAGDHGVHGLCAFRRSDAGARGRRRRVATDESPGLARSAASPDVARLGALLDRGDRGGPRTRGRAAPERAGRRRRGRGCRGRWRRQGRVAKGSIRRWSPGRSPGWPPPSSPFASYGSASSE